MSVPTLEIAMRMGLARLSQDITQAKGMVGTMARDIDRAANTMKNALGAIGVGISVTGLIAFGKHTIDALDKLNDLNKATGIGVRELSGLGFAAKVSGANLEGTAQAINKLSQNIGKDTEKFRALGITAKEPLEAFKQLADIFRSIEDPQLRAALGSAALGKSWATTAGLLDEGGQRIGELVEQGMKLSGVTEEMVAQADELNDKLTDLAGSGALTNRVIGPMLPLLIKAADGLLGMRDSAAEANVGFNPFVETLRALIVIAGTVGFTVRGIALELGGLAAQVGALMTGDFARVATIGQMMKADAVARRQAFDEWEKDILAVTGAAKKAAPAIKEVSTEAERKARAFVDAGKAAKELALADEHVTAWQKALIKELERELDLTQSYVKILGELEEAKQADIDRTRQTVEGIQDTNEQLEFEAKVLGLTGAALAVANVERSRELALRGQTSPLAIARINQLYDEQRALAANLVVMREQASVWNELGDVAGSFFSDLVMNGKSAFDNLKKWVKQLLAEMIALFAKRWILNLAAGGSVLGSAGDALAGGSGALSTAGSLIGMAGGVYSGWTGAAALAGAEAAGTLTTTGIVATGGMGTGAIGVGSSLYSALSAIPVWGWIAMAVIAAIGFFSGRGGGPKPGGSFMADYDANGNFIGTSAVPGTDNGRFFTPTSGDAQMQQFTTDFATGFFSTLGRYGGTTAGMSFGFGFDQDPQGSADSRVSAMVRGADGSIIYSNTATAGRDDEDFQRAITLETQRAILAGLQASELPPSIALIFDGIEPLTATTEELTAAFHNADIGMGALALGIRGLDFQTLQAFQQDGETIEQTLTRVGTAWTWFQDNFTTDAERLERAQTSVTDVFATLGIAIPATTTDFRHLVEGIDVSTEAGRTLFRTLMGVAPAFLLVTNAAGDAADGIGDVTDALDDMVVMTMDLQLRIQEDVRRSRQSQLDDVIGARGGLQGFLNSTRLNTSLTTLDPMQRLNEARRQYEEVLGLAQTGDLGAAGRLGGVSETYLQIAREMFASSSRYVDIFNSVMGGVGGVDARLERDQHMLEATLGMAQTMTEVRDLLIDIRDGTFEAPKRIVASVDNAALATKRR